MSALAQGQRRDGHTAQERFDRRVSARRRRTWKLVGVVMLLAALAAGAWWVLWRSDWLLVEKVAVTGVEERWTDEILAAADISLSQPMVEVDVSGASTSVAELAVVRDVDVVRSWPNTVTIEVAPREPVLAVRQGSGRVALVDYEGVTIEVTSTAPEGVPVVVTKGRAGATAEAYQAAWGVLSTLPVAISGEVTEVQVSSADLVTLELGPRTVVWGGPAESELKGEVAVALLATDAELIDVSAPRSPVTRGAVETSD